MSMLAMIAIFACTAASQPPPDLTKPLPRRPALGAGLAPLTAEQAQAAKASAGQLRITQILPKLTAESVGMKVGDVLIELDSLKPTSPGEIGGYLARKSAGEPVSFTILRDGSQKKLSGVLQPRPSDSGEGFTVDYDHVVSNGRRLRMIVAKPTTPGKKPAIYIIQGLMLATIDFPIASNHYLTPMVRRFLDAGFIVVRQDKAGVGDSDPTEPGGIGFVDETEDFLAGLRWLKKLPDVDPDRVGLFGHSMGGIQAPMLAGEEPVRAVAVYGTGTKPWAEYMIENTRRQSVLAGASPVEVDRELRGVMSASDLLFNQGVEPAEAVKKRPDLESAIRGFFPDLKISSTRIHAFHKELAATSQPEAWSKCNADVLAAWGEVDFVTCKEDHEEIVRIVQSRRGKDSATLLTIPNADHAFYEAATMRDSQIQLTAPTSPPKLHPNAGVQIADWLISKLKAS